MNRAKIWHQRVLILANSAGKAETIEDMCEKSMRFFNFISSDRWWMSDSENEGFPDLYRTYVMRLNDFVHDSETPPAFALDLFDLLKKEYQHAHGSGQTFTEEIFQVIKIDLCQIFDMFIDVDAIDYHLEINLSEIVREYVA